MDNAANAVKLDPSALPVSTPSKRVIVDSNYSVKKPKLLDLSKKKEKPGIHLKAAKPTTVKKPVQSVVGKPCPLPSDAPQKVGCTNDLGFHFQTSSACTQIWPAKFAQKTFEVYSLHRSFKAIRLYINNYWVYSPLHIQPFANCTRFSSFPNYL